jgi:regulator of cell morphogenesis and NO signaling
MNTTALNPATKSVGELALEVPHAIAILEKWKIDYCCHGGRSIEEACASAGVEVGALLAEIGGGRATDDGRQWQQEPLVALVQHIVTTHHVFTREIIETLRLLSAKVAMRHGAHHPEVVTVDELTQQLCDELMPHMQKEEIVLFPYIQGLEGGAQPASCFGTVKNPIRMMMMEHDSAGVLLAELRAVTNDYTLPADACLSFRALYERLVDLEQDLHVHIHLENNVLFPRAAQLEENLSRVECCVE